jgi:hypothetical protein
MRRFLFRVTRPKDIANRDVGALDEAAFAMQHQSIVSAHLRAWVLHYWPSWSLPIVRMSFPTKKCDLDTPKMRGISACRIVGILDKIVPTDPRSLPEANEGL